MKSRRLAVYGLTAGLLGGGAAGLALSGTTLTATRIADVSSPDSTAATTAAPAAPAPAATSAAPQGDWAKSALDPLVKNGTITQAQEDAVIAALQAARPEHGGPGHGGRGGPGFGNLDAAAKALGLTADDLRTALQGGKSLADVAKSKGIDPAKVVDALVAELKAHLDSEVASGEHTQAEADQMLAAAKTRIQDFVNGTAPAGGPGFGGPGGHGHGGPGFGGPGGPGAPAGAPATGSSGSSSGTAGTTTS